MSIDRDLNLVLPGRTPVGFGNHSCDPTLWWSGAFSLSTRRPLQEGDEATLDYATITDAADYVLGCACGTTLCRGQVTGLDWQRLELQHRYHQHWVPALQKRIDRV